MGDQFKKELCEENQIALRYVWYYEDPYIIIPGIFVNWVLLSKLKTLMLGNLLIKNYYMQFLVEKKKYHINFA
jgi:hypothetical protein